MKRVVFISPRFFNLESYISRGFEEAGYNVDFFDERVSSDSLNKILTRKCPSLVKGKINKYYERILEHIVNNDIEFVFVVKAENVPIWFLDAVKTKNPRVKLAHYMYDPIKNYPNILEKTKHFDTCFTFDSADAKRYGWHHRALFYPPTIDDLEFKPVTPKYSGSFVGTLHTDRARVIHNIIQMLPKKIRQSLFIYYYIPLMPMFWIGKYIKRDYTYLKQNEVSTTPLNTNETLNVMNESEFIIDIHHDNQSGLTTRTLESLGMKKKLLTTNPFIKEYDFYHEDNILVVDKYDIRINHEWFERKYNDEIVYNRSQYTINGFITEIVQKTMEG